jgi:hypothetical protein
MTRNEAKRIRANIERTATFDDDKTALESVYDELNAGQRKKPVKSKEIKELFDRYGVNYEE